MQVINKLAIINGLDLFIYLFLVIYRVKNMDQVFFLIILINPKLSPPQTQSHKPSCTIIIFRLNA